MPSEFRQAMERNSKKELIELFYGVIMKFGKAEEYIKKLGKQSEPQEENNSEILENSEEQLKLLYEKLKLSKPNLLKIS